MTYGNALVRARDGGIGVEGRGARVRRPLPGTHRRRPVFYTFVGSDCSIDRPARSAGKTAAQGPGLSTSSIWTLTP